MDAYATASWQPLFAALLGGVAALIGLVFVGVSINLDKIIPSPMQTGRALEALLLFLALLIISTLLLVPGQPVAFLGAELLVVAAVLWAAVVAIQGQALRALGADPLRSTRGQFVGRVVLVQAATLPYAVAAVSLLFQAGGGLYWLVPGVVFSLVAAVTDAWVLLVEILR